MNSSFNNLFDILKEKYQDIISKYDVNELKCYIDYNAHNEYAAVDKNGDIKCYNLDNTIKSDIIVNNENINFIPRVKTDKQNQNDNDIVAFSIGHYLENNVTNHRCIRVNENGFYIETVNIVSNLWTENTIKVEYYDRATMNYIINTSSKNENQIISYDYLDFMTFLINTFGDIRNITSDNLKEKYNIKSDKTSSITGKKYDLDFSIEEDSIMHKTPQIYLRPKYHVSDGTYTTFMKYMLEQGFYKNSSLETIAKHLK